MVLHLSRDWHGLNIARRGGFTLIEVMVALVVLGTAVFVLLDAHYVALRLFATAEDEVDFRQLLEEAVARAELGVFDQTYSGGEVFGARYPDYKWSYDAAPMGEPGADGQDGGLYEVTVTVTGPDQNRSMTFYVYDTALLQDGPEGLSKDSATKSSGSTGRSRADARSGAS